MENVFNLVLVPKSIAATEQLHRLIPTELDFPGKVGRSSIGGSITALNVKSESGNKIAGEQSWQRPQLGRGL